MDISKAQELIDKYRKGTLSAEEEAMLEGWYLKLTAEQRVSISEKHLAQKKQAIWKNLQVNNGAVKIVKFRVLAQIAAAAIVIIAVGILYFHQKDITKQTVNHIAKNDIRPGGNKAYLTLANGKTIVLNTAANGQIANQAGTRVTKTAGGQLVYTLAKKSAANNPAELNTITTPHGGQWQLLLPDGTKVWLNAASSLTYPVSFAALKNRRVELSGEAYFEVAKDKTHPFIVHTIKQDVEVLGTHFNINAYSDEQYIKTTLLEGSVHVTTTTASIINGVNSFARQTLKPGQQSVLSNGDIKITVANTEAAIAWKNAMFYFENDNLESIMKRVARWYDVKIIYQSNQVKQELFSGRVSRAQNVSEVLKMLTLTGAAQFKIEGRDIIVTN
jgi:ferric-dicitrate binding protein FerR (iron transport regulator)